jgi:hypothetical protein
VTVREDNRRIRSIYFDKREWAALVEISNANGQSPNAITRIAVRTLLGLPSVQLTISDDLRKKHGLVDAS